VTSTSVCVSYDGEVPSRAFWLRFEGSFSDAMSVEMQPSPGVMLRLERFRQWCGFLLSRPVERGDSIELVIRSDGEKVPRVDAWEFIPDTLRDGAGRSSMTRAVMRAVAGLEAASLRPGCRVPEPWLHAASFFRDYDIRTNPELLGSRHALHAVTASLTPAARRARMEFVGAVLRTLTRRLEIRLTAPGAERSALLERASADRAAVAHLSALQREVMDRWYPDWHHTLEGWRALVDAFAWFAAGRLALVRRPGDVLARALPLNNGAPDSSAVHCFSEFALLAMVMDIDAHIWRRLFPALVALPMLHHVARYGESGPRSPEELLRPISDQLAYVDDTLIGSVMPRDPPAGARSGPSAEELIEMNRDADRVLHATLRRVV